MFWWNLNFRNEQKGCISGYNVETIIALKAEY